MVVGGDLVPGSQQSRESWLCAADATGNLLPQICFSQLTWRNALLNPPSNGARLLGQSFLESFLSPHPCSVRFIHSITGEGRPRKKNPAQSHQGLSIQFWLLINDEGEDFNCFVRTFEEAVPVQSRGVNIRR